MSENFSLTITNKKIWTFYNENPHMSFETMNILFHDILENLVEDMSKTMNSSVSSQILSTINEQNSHISELKGSLQNMQNTVSQLNNDITNNILVKFMDIKKEYVDDMKTIIYMNNSENNDKLRTYVEKQNEELLNKTSSLIHDIVPKNQDAYSNVITDSLNSFKTDLNQDTRELMKSINNDSIKEFINNFDVKCTGLFQNVHTPIYNYISSSEERIQNTISAVKTSNDVGRVKTENIMDELADYLKKFKNSSFKGNMGESELDSVLTKMFPSGEVINTSTTKASGDFILKRDNKPTIMLENKAYDRNVNPDEVKKFIRDSEELHMHSVFLSQHTGITCKPNYHIEIHKGSILVYVHNVEYSPEKIQVAIDIIENLDDKLDVIYSENEENVITTEVLDDINREFQAFITQRDAIVSMTKDHHKKILTQLENLNFVSLDKYLSTKYASARKTGIVCDICNVFNAPNKKSLSAHQRGCRKTNAFLSVDTR